MKMRKLLASAATLLLLAAGSAQSHEDEGKGDLGSGGTWQVTVTAMQNGQAIASKQLTVNATGGM